MGSYGDKPVWIYSNKIFCFEPGQISFHPDNKYFKLFSVYLKLSPDAISPTRQLADTNIWKGSSYLICIQQKLSSQTNEGVGRRQPLIAAYYKLEKSLPYINIKSTHVASEKVDRPQTSQGYDPGHNDQTNHLL